MDYSLLLVPLLVAVVVAATHVPLGQQVVRRGIIFIDLAIAQIAGLGIIAAHSFHWEVHGWQVQVLAVAAALLGAYLIYLIECFFPAVQEALIGVVFVLAASAAILLLASNPQGGEHLKDLLVGQILWVSWTDVWPVAVLYVLVLGLWFFWTTEHTLKFYLLFALTVTQSVQLVGVYLVFASLIIPALASYRLKQGRLLWGYAICFTAYGLGLLASFWFDLPAGAMIVWLLMLVALLLRWTLLRQKV